MNNKIRIRIAVVLIQDGKILLVRHFKNGKRYWLLPGGGLEYGETIEAGALRELREETNLDISLGDLILVNESIPPDQHRHVLNLYYWGKILGGELKVGKDKVLDGAEFVDINAIFQLEFYPNVKNELLQIIKNPNRPYKLSLGNRWE